jgi:diacylglycerol kinase
MIKIRATRLNSLARQSDMTNIRSAITYSISGFQVLMLPSSDSKVDKNTMLLIVIENIRLNLETISWLLIRNS